MVVETISLDGDRERLMCFEGAAFIGGGIGAMSGFRFHGGKGGNLVLPLFEQVIKL